MNVKYAISVLETIGSGATLSNVNDKESACIMAIEALDKLDKIENIVNQQLIVSKNKKIEGYLNIEQLTEVINSIAFGRACGYYCGTQCELRNNVNKCYEYMNSQPNGVCNKYHDVACRIYAEHIMYLYNNGLKLE